VVYDVIRKLKLNRAAGDDCINAKLIKNGGKHLWKCIFDLILAIWNKEVMPADWKTAVICPIHKKGNKLECNNYRGISLLNVTYKIFTNILTKHIETYTEEFIGEY
jgi:sorting nexin-29